MPFAFLGFLALTLLTMGALSSTERRYRRALLLIAGGLLSVGLFLWVLWDWNRVMIRVNEEYEQRQQFKGVTTEPAARPTTAPQDC